MMRIYWHLMGRFYEARAMRALNRFCRPGGQSSDRIRYQRLKAISEKFFRRVPRAQREGAPEEEEA